MQDIREAAVADNIPLNQLTKIISNLAKQQRIRRLRRGLYTTIGMLSVIKIILLENVCFIIFTYIVSIIGLTFVMYYFQQKIRSSC